MDFNLKFFDNRRILGDGKTWRGFAVGVFAAVVVGLMYMFILPLTGFNFYPDSFDYLLLGIVSGVGTMTGDAIGSFIKRRMNIERGAPFFFFDQLLFLYTSLLFTGLLGLSIVDWIDLIWLTILTYLIHRCANILANRLGWKKVPW